MHNEETATTPRPDSQPGPVVLGIDIGARGAIARLTTDGKLIGVLDMPVLHDGPKGRPSVNAAILAEIIRSAGPVVRAYVEYVSARPEEGPVGAFAFGRSRGVIEGVLGSFGISVTMMSPATWKRTVGIPPGSEGAKDRARSETIRRWPAEAEWFARGKDDGRAEASLIGAAGLLRERP